VRLRTHTQTLWRLVSRARLQTKIMGISLAAIVLLGLALTWQVRSMMASALASELEARGYSVAKTLATRSTDLILTNDLYDLYAVTRDTVQSNQDVRYAFILDAQGRLLAHSFDDGFPPDLLEANGVRAEEPYHQQVLLSEEGLLQDIAVPVFGGRAGVARVGLSHERLDHTLADATRQILLTTGLVSLLGVGISAALTWLLTRPVLDLAQATRRVASGDLQYRLTPWADDEIGELQASFNMMAEELQRKEDLRRQLLRKVMTIQEDERRRIARELHDETGQALTSLLVGLKVIERAPTLEQACLLSANLRQVVGETIDSVRNLALELRPSMLDDLGLVPALARYVQSCPSRFGLQADFAAPGMEELRLPPEVETTLYRIAQEALTNVARHAKATHASVLLERRQGAVVMVIEDNGQGFDVTKALSAARQQERFGLYGMAERAALSGCRLEVESKPGVGTTISVEVPWEGI